jgi:uncharacterized protein
LTGKRRFSGLDLAHALDQGTKTAYKAVAKPVEGTILTVIRETSAAAIAAAERDNTIATVLEACVEAAERSVARTPSLLPILREAHVVDSGGQGLFRLFQGALAAAQGRPAVAASAEPVAHPRAPGVAAAPAGVEEGAWGYETVYLLSAAGGHELDVGAIQAHLESIGDSVLVAGDNRMVKVHVHNDRPDQVIAYGLSLGTLARITIENLDSQAHDVREARAAAFVHEGPAADQAARVSVPGAGQRGPDHGDADAGHDSGDAAAQAGGGRAGAEEGAPGEPDSPAATPLELGVVVVAPSDGLAAVLSDVATMFREYGAFRIVRGGQSANPSTGELLEAVAATAANELLVLPNNPNVILAAKQVAEMADRPVHVVPTRNCAEGVAALLELDPDRSGADNAAAMTEASRTVQTMQVTEAVRDAVVSGRKVKHGQTIALDPDDGLLAVDGDPHKAVLAALSKLDAGFGLITLYYGEDTTLDDAETLARKVRAAAAGVDVEVVHGGQPHYRYLVAAE